MIDYIKKKINWDVLNTSVFLCISLLFTQRSPTSSSLLYIDTVKMGTFKVNR